MKRACLLFPGQAILTRQGKSNPFRPAERGRLPFLVTVKSVDLAPVCPALDAGAVAGQQAQPAGYAARIELGVLRALGLLLAITVLVCSLGAQQVAHNRERQALGRQLRQKEIELRALTQAYRSLECEKALLAAHELPRTTAGGTRVEVVRKAATDPGGRLSARQQGRPVLARATSDVPSSRRSQVANSRPVARRGEIRG